MWREWRRGWTTKRKVERSERMKEGLEDRKNGPGRDWSWESRD